MINYLKQKINQFFFNRIEAYSNQRFSQKNKWGVKIPDNSSFGLPLDISGGNNISIGNFSSIGKYAWLGAYTEYLHVEFNPKIIVGDNVKIGNYACIVSVKSIKIDDNVLISEYFYVSDHSHGCDVNTDVRPALQPLKIKENGVYIGKNTFIGYMVTVLPGVSIGKNCVVGSHSVVTKSFPDFSMIAGAPAKLIKKYDFTKNDWVSV
ncbi:DapH/DapD/GlmU-related protein [Hymenobacter sp.]|uniref:DapH/DapD/GlmU-related protein n=1 Tax=Hymenobacter sp. TaxID=1898978 RepID=UPI00286A00CA|nr:DapH/DapD/GlmU-related protein [Hymenobacter sp.]